MKSNIYFPEKGCYSSSECGCESACIVKHLDVRYEGVKLCKDPCYGYICGKDAECKVTSHKPICVCKSGYFGDPRYICIESKLNLISENMTFVKYGNINYISRYSF